MREFVALRTKTYSYLMDHGNSDKKSWIEFNDYKKCLQNNEIILKSQERF